ncbi:MAG: hypothetical protein C0406_00950 [Sideroxydans sp.]|nr:hypothetical protein [Sideroxydans sp.]
MKPAFALAPAPVNKLVYEVALLVRAVCNASSVLSITLSLVGVKTVVMGSIPANCVDRPRAVFTFVVAVDTWPAEIAASCVVVKPANHELGVAVPAKLAINRSVSGVTLTLPALVAME